MIKRVQPKRSRSNVRRHCHYVISIMLAIGIWLLSGTIVQAAESAQWGTQLGSQLGAEVFQAQCAGCHLGGGNIVRRGKTLKLKALERNHVDTLEAVQALVRNGQGNMSAYGDRLTPEAITAVSEYVLAQAAQGWPGN
jgi:cytochrome c6